MLLKRKHPILEPLSIAENGGQDHIMAAQMTGYHDGSIFEFYLGFDDVGNVTLRKSHENKGHGEIRLPPIDIDSMILFLQEAKEFIAEAETFRTLATKRKPW